MVKKEPLAYLFLLVGLPHCDLKCRFWGTYYDANFFFRKSTIESGGQAIENSSNAIQGPKWGSISFFCIGIYAKFVWG